MKKIIATLLAAVTLCASISGMCLAAEERIFPDVSVDAWYYEDVKAAVSMGLVGGKSGGIYAPNDNLTYAEAIKLAACMHKSCTQGTTEFERTPVWYTPYVTYAEETGIKLRNYNLNAKVTRADFLDIFSRALPADMMNEINRIADGDIPDVPMTYENSAAIYKLYRVGIVAGSDDAHNCRPGTNIKRSEVAAILVRMMDPSKRVSFKIKISDDRARYSTGYGVYDEKLSEYYDAIAMEDEEYWKVYGNNSSINMEKLYYARNGGQVEYALYDVNGDGIHELLLLMGEYVIDIYTSKDGVLKKLFPNCTFGEDEYLNVLADGKLLVSRLNGPYAAEFTVYQINGSANGVLKVESVYHDEGGQDIRKSNYEYVSFDEYNRRLTSYEATSVVNQVTRRVVADAIEVTKETHYNRGTDLFDKTDYLVAAKEFELAGDYMNAEQLMLESYFIHGTRMLNMGNTEEGVRCLNKCGTYKDAPTVIEEYYYNTAKAALKHYITEYGVDSISYLDKAYNDAIDKLKDCNGYKDTAKLIEQVELTYEVKRCFLSKSGYATGNFKNASFSFSGDNVTFTAPEFTESSGEKTELVLKYNIKSKTFNAVWSNIDLSDPATSSKNTKAWTELIECFTDITDTRNLSESYSDTNSGLWYSGISASEKIFERRYDGYRIKTTVKVVDGKYEIDISVGK